MHSLFNASCTYDQCYKMGATCRDELATEGKDEADKFCRRWCCALLVASGRSDLTVANATSLRAKDGVPMVIIGQEGVCKSLTDSASDEWCTTTCKGNMDNCPA